MPPDVNSFLSHTLQRRISVASPTLVCCAIQTKFKNPFSKGSKSFPHFLQHRIFFSQQTRYAVYIISIRNERVPEGNAGVSPACSPVWFTICAFRTYIRGVSSLTF